MEQEICTIFLGKNQMDNDYTFYDDGRIKREYDAHATKLNQVVWLKAADIPEKVKQQLIENCSADHIERIKQILG